MQRSPFIKHKVLLIFLFSSFSAQAQIDSADINVYNNSVRNALSLYHHFMNDASGLYNGSEYVSYAQTIQEGIPFFESSEFNNGSIVYGGILYENVPLSYDLVKEEVVTRAPSNFFIKLINDRVTGFSLLNHRFVRLIKDSTNKIKTGFYDILYEGGTTVYKKTTKTIGEDLSSGKLRTFIIESHSYYLKKNNLFFNITNKKDLISVLKDNKNEVQSFIRKNNLNIRKDKDNALPAIMKYYDEIKHEQGIKN